jgi:hypothetical protein
MLLPLNFNILYTSGPLLLLQSSMHSNTIRFWPINSLFAPFETVWVMTWWQFQTCSSCISVEVGVALAHRCCKRSNARYESHDGNNFQRIHYLATYIYAIEVPLLGDKYVPHIEDHYGL